MCLTDRGSKRHSYAPLSEVSQSIPAASQARAASGLGLGSETDSCGWTSDDDAEVRPQMEGVQSSSAPAPAVDESSCHAFPIVSWTAALPALPHPALPWGMD